MGELLSALAAGGVEGSVGRLLVSFGVADEDHESGSGGEGSRQ